MKEYVALYWNCTILDLIFITRTPLKSFTDRSKTYIILDSHFSKNISPASSSFSYNKNVSGKSIHLDGRVSRVKFLNDKAIYN